MAEGTDPTESRREQRMIERARQRLERTLSKSSIQRAMADAVNASKSGDSLQLDKLAQKIISRVGRQYSRALELDSNPIIRVFSPTPPQPPSPVVGSTIEIPDIILPTAPDDDKLYVLGIQNKQLKWVETEDC